MTITFYNKSELPIEFVQTFGVSAKENEHPIGYFGTGLKYAIAVLLREKCDVMIGIGEYVYKFSTQKQMIRNKEFDFVYMDDNMLAFTLELGKNWSLWQAYRELYSNCMDEQGEIKAYEFCPTEGTSIMVTGDAFDELHEKRGEFILLSTPKYTLKMLEVHESETPAIFYKGIRVLDLETKYSYNILTDIELTEDRTAHQWDVEAAITQALVTSDNVDAIIDVLSIDEDSEFYEAKFNYSKYVKPSDSFMKLMGKMKKAPHNVSAFYGHYREDFIGGLPKEAMNKSIRTKLDKLRALFKNLKPKDVHVIALEDQDYKLVNDELCLNVKLFDNPHKLAFVYMLACIQLKDKRKRVPYQIITEDMLKYFTVPKGDL